MLRVLPLLVLAGMSQGLSAQPTDVDRLTASVATNMGSLAEQIVPVSQGKLDRARADVRRAKNFAEQGKFDDAASLFSKALTVLKTELGIENEESLRVTNELAVVQMRQGRYSEAEQALTTRISKCGAHKRSVRI